MSTKEGLKILLPALRRVVKSRLLKQGIRSFRKEEAVNWNEEILIKLIEESLITYGEATSLLTPLGIPGLQGFIGPSSESFANMVGMARLDESKADGIISQVIDRFTAEDKGFFWMVGPGSTPPDLGTRLEAAGLEMSAEAAGTALIDLHQSLAVNPAIRIEEVGWEEMRKEADFF